MLLLIAVIALVLFLIQYYWFNLSKTAQYSVNIPGPKPLPFIGCVLEIGFNTVDVMRHAERLWREHGNLVKFWFGPYLLVLITDVKYAQHFLSSSIHNGKSFMSRFSHAWVGTGLATSTGKKWSNRRKMLTPSFHFEVLEKCLDVFNSNTNTMIQKLKEKADGPKFDVSKDITLCTCDIICESIMGVQQNAQNKHSDYLSSVRGITDVMVMRGLRPWLYPELLFNMSELGKRQKTYLKTLHGTANEVIKSRKRELRENAEKVNGRISKTKFGKQKRLAFLDLLLEYSRGGANLTDQEIREEVDTFMFAGFDSTSLAASFCLMLLAEHPEYQNKVYEEQNKIFDTSDREITMKDLQDMKYLECVIKETLRLYPSFPFYGRTLQEDVNIDGLKLAQGTQVLFSPFLMNRNPEYFPEPETFDPDRFSADNVHGRNPFTYLPFSAGPRSCIGQRFAMLLLKCMISKIVRNFKLFPTSQEVVLLFALTLKTQGGIVLKLENRKQ